MCVKYILLLDKKKILIICRLSIISILISIMIISIMIL